MLGVDEQPEPFVEVQGSVRLILLLREVGSAMARRRARADDQRSDESASRRLQKRQGERGGRGSAGPPPVIGGRATGISTRASS